MQRFNFGDFRRLTPVGTRWGWERGTPVDRYYIEAFLRNNSHYIRGNTLEGLGNDYARAIGGERVARRYKLDVTSANQPVDVIADLNRDHSLPANLFDCIILTQTLQYISNIPASIANIHNSLCDGGCALITVPGISKYERAENYYDWVSAFTPIGLSQAFSNIFGSDFVSVSTYGNIFAATCFLYGLSNEEITSEEMDVVDPEFPVLIGLRAVKVRPPKG